MINKSEKELRLEKLQALKDKGLNPYPSVTPAHISLGLARTHQEGDVVAVVGRIDAIREHGKSTFIDLVEETEKLQNYFKFDEVGPEPYELLKLLDIGDYLWAKGQLFVTKAGELSLKVKEYQLLSKSLLPIPDSWQGLEDIETRYRQRALDLKINQEAHRYIASRSHVIKELRSFMEKHGFTEVQTPILQPIPGGATAKPFVTHHNALDTDFYLRISPELYLKRLVVGGFERVYEIGPAFRNEGLSHLHNPEFTMFEFYWAYQTYEGLMAFTQKMLQHLVEQVHGSLELKYQDHVIHFGGDFAIKKYSELIEEETGIDIGELTTFEQIKKAIEAKKIKIDMTDITVWAKLVDELFKKVVRPKIIQPTFVIDYPTEMTPLAKQRDDNPTIAQQFQLVLAGGNELIKAYSELNDPLEQERRFKEQAKLKEAGWDETMAYDENFVEALKYGMPPTAGWGMGIERLMMILTGVYSIKEVIPFPTLKPKK